MLRRTRKHHRARRLESGQRLDGAPARVPRITDARGLQLCKRIGVKRAAGRRLGLTGTACMTDLYIFELGKCYWRQCQPDPHLDVFHAGDDVTNLARQQRTSGVGLRRK